MEYCNPINVNLVTVNAKNAISSQVCILHLTVGTNIKISSGTCFLVTIITQCVQYLGANEAFEVTKRKCQCYIAIKLCKNEKCSNE